MVREYINELLSENAEELDRCEKQMNDLLDDLDAAKKWLETLQIEKNVDANIFSPRAMDFELKNKIEKAQNNINKINQDIEYVRSFIETHIKKKQEYEKLLEEVNLMENQGKQTSSDQKETEISIQKEISVQEETKESDTSAQSNNLKESVTLVREENLETSIYEKVRKPESFIQQENSKISVPEESKKPETSAQEADSEISLQENSKLSETEQIFQIEKEFLSSLYRKAEICLALINSNRKRCKSELKSMKTMIEEYLSNHLSEG